MTRQEMITMLKESECRVIFKKVNGEERDMRCTLMESKPVSYTHLTLPTKA